MKVSILLEFAPGPTMGTRGAAVHAVPHRVLLIEDASENDVARANALSVDPSTHLATERQVVSLLGDIGWVPVSTLDGALDVQARVIAHLLGKSASGSRTGRDVLAPVVAEVAIATSIAEAIRHYQLPRVDMPLCAQLANNIVRFEVGTVFDVPCELPTGHEQALFRIASIVLAERGSGWVEPVFEPLQTAKGAGRLIGLVLHKF